MDDKENFLNDNLANTFNGTNVIGEIMIAGRLHKIVEAKDDEGNTYTDIWIAGGRLTAGREVGLYNGQTITRSYEGGHVDLKDFPEIKGDDILKFLGEVIASEQTTRLNQNVSFKNGVWSYNYQVVSTHPKVKITNGMEEISYKGQVVFVHSFAICPLEA